MKLTTRYEQTSCRLVLEGLPDLSSGQGEQSLGILTGFSLAIAGRTELEGQREHLLALLQVVAAYARHLLSAVPRGFGDASSPVSLQPLPAGGHALQLRSSQPDTPPLTLTLDDAELADLVRCLDQMRLDPRVLVPLDWPQPQPLRRRELHHRQPLARRLAAPVAGVAALAVAAAAVLLIPTPKAPLPSPATTAAPAKAG
ncbi:MAG: DUF4335 domain-containing protein [Synechococcaceae bacterium WB8_1B_136]|nr:DUF4335 domain-containing protein [Synechococcaceae bacterium WB8_1B_136]